MGYADWYVYKIFPDINVPANEYSNSRVPISIPLRDKITNYYGTPQIFYENSKMIEQYYHKLPIPRTRVGEKYITSAIQGIEGKKMSPFRYDDYLSFYGNTFWKTVIMYCLITPMIAYPYYLLAYFPRYHFRYIGAPKSIQVRMTWRKCHKKASGLAGYKIVWGLFWGFAVQYSTEVWGEKFWIPALSMVAGIGTIKFIMRLPTLYLAPFSVGFVYSCYRTVAHFIRKEGDRIRQEVSFDEFVANNVVPYRVLKVPERCKIDAEKDIYGVPYVTSPDV